MTITTCEDTNSGTKNLPSVEFCNDEGICFPYTISSGEWLENEIYAAVSKKKDYTLAHFKEKHLYSNNQNKLF